jgi:hypothetical protein
MVQITLESGTIHELAEAVRDGCLQAARQAYLDASENGLCDEGAIEAAFGAIQSFDPGNIIKQFMNR